MEANVAKKVTAQTLRYANEYVYGFEAQEIWQHALTRDLQSAFYIQY